MEAGQYEAVVDACYAALYRFAYSLTHSAADAADLTQEAFSRLAANHSMLRDPSKARTWLFTTVYRGFLQARRHQNRFPEVDLLEVDSCLPAYVPEPDISLDSATALAVLLRMSDTFRIPVTLFYLDQHSYQEIAQILGVPIGTVMSRIARGKAMLREQLLAEGEPSGIKMKIGVI